MKTHVRLALVPAVVSLAALAGCSDEPTAPSSASAARLTPVKPVAAISDATHGIEGDKHFFWLPPIGPDTTDAGPFDPALQPQIRICRVATQPSSFRGQPTVASGVVYVVNGAQVEARQESGGSLVWSWTPPTGQPVGPMIATKNLLLVSTGTTTYAVDLASRVPVWSYPAGGHLTLSAQGILFIAQSSGRLTAVSVR